MHKPIEFIEILNQNRTVAALTNLIIFDYTIN